MLTFSKCKGDLFTDQIKEALKSLEGSVVKLESAVYGSKKARVEAQEKVVKLKQVVKNTYERLDRALIQFKQGAE